MNKNSLTDYLACILFKLAGLIIRSGPKDFSLFLGRRLGDLFYYLDYRHRALACANIKRALAGKEDINPVRDRSSLGDRHISNGINGITKEFFRNFGQNLMEIFFIPLINEEYIKKYITIEGEENVVQGFNQGKGIIFAAIHEGSWELSNLISSNLGFPFVFFARVQKYPRLNKLLNSYRLHNKGSRLIERTAETMQGNSNAQVIKYLIKSLRDNQGLGMTVDQGGKNGLLVKFFGRDASMSTGAVKLALKHNAVILPAFYVRINGPYHKIIIKPAFNLRKTENTIKDVQDNLQELVKIFEDLIRMYPQEYLWSYKIWKYSRTRQVLVLSDGRTGHLRQSESAVKIIADYWKERNIETTVVIKEVRFRNRLSSQCQAICSLFAGKYQCQGCQWCLRKFVVREDYEFLAGSNPDIVISCGSSLAAVNYIVSCQNQAKSIVIMRSQLVSMDKFNLVVIPRHDNPPKRKNVVVTSGALNLVDDEYLQEQSQLLLRTCEQLRRIPTLQSEQAVGVSLHYRDGHTRPLQITGPAKAVPLHFYIGFLIGGDAKNFHLERAWIKDIIAQLKQFVEKSGVKILVSTSRRTSKQIELLIKEEFGKYPHCPLLILANEKNYSFAVGGIIGLSQLVIVTPESISMVSEAASSSRYVLVCKADVDSKHNRFLRNLSQKKHIYLAEANRLAEIMAQICDEKPEINRLDDRAVVREAIQRRI